MPPPAASKALDLEPDVVGQRHFDLLFKYDETWALTKSPSRCPPVDAVELAEDDMAPTPSGPSRKVPS